MEETSKEIFDAKEKVNNIIEELDNYIGLNKSKEVLYNIEKYHEVYGLKDEKQYNDYNIIISIKSKYDLYMDLIKVIKEMYIFLGIIPKDSKILYINMNNVGNNFLLNDIKNDENIVLIDILDCQDNYSEIRYKIELAKKEYPKKIYIILENDWKGRVYSIFINDFQWYININELSNEDKSQYIKEFLLKNEIKSNDEWINKLAKEPYYNIKNRLTNVLVQCKLNNEWKVIDVEENSAKQKNNKDKTGMEELNELIGLDTVKEQIIQIVNYLKICKNRKNMPMLHMIFQGSPGTGKSTVARIVGKIFAEENILSDKSNFVEVQRADLIGKYVGQTAPLTKEKIKQALGGILFVDEAYTLASYIQDEGGRDYGAECIATLIKEMEDHRNELCVILAGYTKEMNRLLKSNTGFDSRIQFKIDFPDYSQEELYQIFEQLCYKEGYRTNKNTKDILLKHFEEIKSKDNFSNVRYIRSLFEKIKIEQANRVIRDLRNKDNIISIDVKKVINKLEEKKEPIKKIGFSA